MDRTLKVVFFLLLVCSHLSSSQHHHYRSTISHEHLIKKVLLQNKRYDRTTRPVRNDSSPVTVNLAISLYHILDTNEKEQTFTCLLSIRQRWTDEYLRWNPGEFGGVEHIRIPATSLWLPDLVISNFAGDKFNDYLTTNAIVSCNGSILWMYPALIKTYCTLNVKYFPFDSQSCEIIFISWTYNGDELDVVYNKTFENMVYYISKNQEWAVKGITAERHTKKYACCKELYPDVTFTIHMTRGSLFYILNLIAPCFLIFLISFLAFFLPVESGEKVNLEMTILLALVVFLLMVGESMPPTPDAIPILGMFFGSTMVMVTVALVMSVIVTNIYAKKDSHCRAPIWCMRVVFKFYPPTMSHHNNKNNTDRGNNQMEGDDSNASPTTLPPYPPSDLIIQKLSSPPTFHLSHLRARRAESPPSQEQQTPYKNFNTKPKSCFSIDNMTVVRRCEANEENDFINQMAHPDELSSSFVNSKTPFPLPSEKLSNGDDDEDEWMEVEWKILAKFLDRMFFWIFLAMSTIVHTILFRQMVPE